MLIKKFLQTQIIVKQAVVDCEKSVNEKFVVCERRSKTACITFTVLFFLISMTFGCQPNQSILNSGQATNSGNSGNSAERPKDTFESALRGVQRSGFSYIFVIRRKDGGKFGKEDKTYVRTNSPAETNQFILTDEDRVIIAGSNYPFPEENLELLRKVFSVEDLSPEKEANVNADSNGANKKISNSADGSNSNPNSKNAGNK